MAQPIRIRARRRDAVTEVTVLAPHAMETGMRRDDRGQLVPAHHITELVARVGDRVLLRASMTIAVASDPLLTFRVRDLPTGSRIDVQWTDSRGERRIDSHMTA
ncbi:MAG: thiosulfate oxidation carrier complex protein SoxZ [Rubrivivax sp.]|jgi:sulfur-oxidizing protein SoxZ|nr:thiosulfate oxidation carrier complex protein SoxZ [Rubrivivax sp.]